MSYRIAIIDDSPADSRLSSALAGEWAQSRSAAVQTQTFGSAEEFLYLYEQDKCWDMLLLDIEMTGMDGVKLARRIRSDSEAVQIIFITGHSDYIAEGYDVAALHYLMKPVDREKFMQVLDRAAERLRRAERTLMLKSADELIRLPLGKILYLEAARNYVSIRTEDGGVHTVRRRLGDFAGELDKRFLRVGRSYIVNLSKLGRVGRNELQFSDGSVIPLPRGFYEAVNRAIIENL